MRPLLTEQRIDVRGDASTDYGLIMRVMGDLSNAGYASPRRGDMRWAISASVVLHLGFITGAWLFMQPNQVDMSTAEAAISIDIISMEDVVTEPSQTISEATANLVSAGMTQSAAEPLESETAEPDEAAAAQPVTAATVIPVTETVAPSDAEILEHLDETARLSELQPTPELREITTASITPATPVEPLVESAVPGKVANLAPVLEPVTEEVVETTPVPAPRTVRKPVEAEAKPVEDNKPVQKKSAEKKKTKQVASLGNGGENEADSAASKAAGGKPGKVGTEGGNSAAYAGKVRAKVIKALKRPSGSYDAGEARVTFTIDVRGSLVSVRISGSSGDAKVDKAVVAAVERAAPFPSFSDGGPRAFTFPLMIQ